MKTPEKLASSLGFLSTSGKNAHWFDYDSSTGDLIYLGLLGTTAAFSKSIEMALPGDYDTCKLSQLPAEVRGRASELIG